MQPIVNPIFIYLLSILDGIHNLITIFILLSIIVFIVPVFLIVYSWFEGYDISIQKYKSYIKKGLIYFIFFNLLGIFIPTKESAIMIYTSKFVTVNNINTSKEFLLNTFQEVMDIINKESEEE